MNRTKLFEAIWMVAAVLFLFSPDFGHRHLSDSAFQVLYWVAIAQLGFGLFINPAVRRYVKVREDRMARAMADAILSNIRK